MNLKFLISIGLICAATNNVFATCDEDTHLRFNSVTINDPSTLIVSPDTSINVIVNGGLKSGGDWDSTYLEIVGVSNQCFSHPNSQVNGNSWVNRINTFTVTTPQLSGVYILVIRMHRSNCDSCYIETTRVLYVGLIGETGPQGPQGPQGEPGENGSDGQNCSLIQNEDGSFTFTCGETSTILNDGENGSPGINCYDLNENGQEDFCDPNGLNEFGSCESFWNWCFQSINDVSASKNGRLLKVITAMSINQEGFDCNFSEDLNGDNTIDVLDCDGPRGYTGNPGTNGHDGTNGANGLDGQDGSSCSVVDNGNNTYSMSCTDGTSVTWSNGIDGSDGSDGQNGVDGQSCIMVLNNNGTSTITCGNSQFVLGDNNELNLPLVNEPQFNNEGPQNTTSPCGSFDGLTLLLMILPISFLALKRN